MNWAVFEKSVGAVIFRQEGNVKNVLLLHYPSGHWDFPKGHVEKGETDEETLRREVMEETGIADLRLSQGFKAYIGYFYRAKEEEKLKRQAAGKSTNIFKKVTYYIAETQTVDVRISSEHIGYVWLPFKEAIEKVTFKNGRNVLEKAQKFLNGVK
jgi:8-oxo-dGTP pyrophosphatase MutT (NUDIX family)